MELSDLSLELGLNLDDSATIDLHTFGSDSDYSSCGNDYDPSSLFFPDLDLHTEKESVHFNPAESAGSINDDSSDMNCTGMDLMNPIQITEDIPCDGKRNSPTIIAIEPKSNIISFISNATVAPKFDSVNAVNQHDYAVSVKSIPTDLPMKIFKPSIEHKPLLSASKLVPKPITEAKVSTKTMLKSFHVGSSAKPCCNTKSPEVESGFMTKNALAARENRMKKKHYVQSLENSVKNLKTENVNLKKQVCEMSASITEMATELQYLKSILENVDVISGLVKGIKGLPEFQAGGKKRRSVEGQNKTLVSKRCKIAKPCSFTSEVFSGSDERAREQPGICVHLRGSDVSLELCHHCNQRTEKSKN